MLQTKMFSLETILVCIIVLNLFGGAEEDRTPDPLRARQVLSQLSYTPTSFFRCRLSEFEVLMKNE